MAKSWLRQSTNYEIETELYTGPLDLLLDLIQKAELDITKLALAQVTDQFLAYIEAHHDAEPDNISEFLVIASKLVQIKSEALLPRPPAREEDEEDPGELLAYQLQLYKKVKDAAHWLGQRIDSNLRGYLHVPRAFEVRSQIDLTGIEINDLILALESLLKETSPAEPEGLISIPRLTLKRKLEEIISRLRMRPSSSFQELLGSERTRLNMIVVFLAILELTKQDLVITEQPDIFADIRITAREGALEAGDREITFDDES
ncbi:MAG: segregation/condensation protein A [Chloroflexi bacterium]|jgi:segregation and condensation protein A|nr:segregation/condensation protein A [Anaerolineaceae bacterium]NLI43849.1 segregation/condensation protein A [Chloroflexota bacterium]HOE35030.1 segregation/condensation protein A [Anaerolineaceae bacterium]HQK03549.1 segregation/condensation protein A [Anaerolineaceae bacterium]